MNINLSTKQFLMIYDKLGTSKEMVEVKNKMANVIIDALNKLEDASNQTKFPQWIKKEQEKIDALDKLNQNLLPIKDLIKEANQINDGLFARPEKD